MYHTKITPTTSDNFFTSNGFALVSAFILGMLYFLPAIFIHHKVFLLGADNGVLNVPALMELGHQLRHGIFQGVDWSTHNGASDFFLRSNFTIYNPIWMLIAFVFHPVSFYGAVDVTLGVYVFLLILVIFIMQKLGKQFLFMHNKWIALLFAIIYAFSNQVSNCLSLEPFYFTVMLFPMLVYASLAASISSSRLTLFLLSFVDFLFLWAGYIPIALCGSLLSLLFTIYYIYQINPTLYVSKKQAVINTFIPMIIAGLIALPGYMALKEFFSIASTAGEHGLIFAAYAISEEASKLLNVVSGAMTYGRLEHYVVFGLLPLTFLGCFISILSLDAPFFKPAYRSQKNIIFFALTLIAISALITFGRGVYAASTLFYIFPAIGKMHSYQRYFLLCYLFFAGAIALIVEYILENKDDRVLRQWSGFLCILIVAISVMFCLSPENLGKILNSSQMQMELLLSIFALVACILFSFRGAVLTIIFAFVIIGFQYGYGIQFDAVFPTHILYKSNDQENTDFINFLKTHSHKKLIKYMNFSNQPYSYIPPNYPWIVHDQINLANYIGYEEHLSEDDGYRQYVRFYGDVDWQWLRETGNDYIIYDEAAYQKYKSQFDQFADPSIRMVLSNKEIVAKVKDNFPVYPEGNWSYVDDNGYVILLSQGSKSHIDSFAANDQKTSFKLEVNGNGARILLPIWANRHLQLQVNGGKVNFNQWHHHYYYDFKPGNYAVKIVYKNFIQNVFLWMMAIYCLAIIIAIICKIKRKI